MTVNGEWLPANSVTPQLVTVTPTPARVRLNNIREVRREMAKVYSEARSGMLRKDDATRLVYILTQLSNLIRDSELEERVVALEAEYARR